MLHLTDYMLWGVEHMLNWPTAPISYLRGSPPLAMPSHMRRNLSHVPSLRTWSEGLACGRTSVALGRGPKPTRQGNAKACSHCMACGPRGLAIGAPAGRAARPPWRKPKPSTYRQKLSQVKRLGGILHVRPPTRQPRHGFGMHQPGLLRTCAWVQVRASTAHPHECQK